jgi:hypothetical protein
MEKKIDFGMEVGLFDAGVFINTSNGRDNGSFWRLDETK